MTRPDDPSIYDSLRRWCIKGMFGQWHGCAQDKEPDVLGALTVCGRFCRGENNESCEREPTCIACRNAILKKARRNFKAKQRRAAGG